MRVARRIGWLFALGYQSLAAQTPVALTGMVRDSASQPLADVLIFLDNGTPWAVTDSTGVFNLEGVLPGAHAIHYRGTGYAPRSFAISVAETDRVRDVGTVALSSGPLPTATLRGTVREAAGDQLLAGAVIEVNGQSIAVTDSVGTFGISGAPVRWGRNEILIRHSSFEQTVQSDEFWIMAPEEDFEFAIALDIAPVPLPGVTVEATRAEPIPERLQGFYARREKGGGTFWTQEEILLKDAPNMTQLFRGIRFRGMTTGRPCAPVVVVNGLPGDMRDLTPEILAGVEIYRSIGFAPIEFSHLGSNCGMIVLWTRG